MGASEFMVENEGVQLFCKRYEAKTQAQGVKEPLLLIHGGCIDSDFFDACGPLLAGFYDVVTYDRRGFGRTTLPENGDFSVAAQARDAYAVVRASFGEAPVHVAAHSAGGPIGLGFALEYPSVVNAVLLFEPPILSAVDSDGPLMQTINSIRRNVAEEQESGKFSSGFLFGLGKRDPRGARLTPEQRKRNAANIYASLHYEVDTFFNFKPNWDELSKLPVVVATGELNREGPLEGLAMALSEKISCPLLRFPGAHNCPADWPAEFTAATFGAFQMAQRGLLG